MEQSYIDQTCAAILEQLGGARFRMMTGAKNFSYVCEQNKNVHVYFKIGKNAAGINNVRIIYNYGMDHYSMVFSFISVKGIKEKARFDGVYCDQLEELFRDTTGLETRMPRFA